MKSIYKIISGVLLGLGSVSAHSAPAPAPLQLEEENHIAIIGSALADRFQLDGWFEAYFQAQFPQSRLSFRNLAASGDEVSIRHRSQDFGTPEEWLSLAEADLIFAFFGFNESFAGESGLNQFKSDLAEWIDRKRADNYSGDGAPQLVLFSPIANERTRDPNFADPSENNARIELYTNAMREVAEAKEVLFLDLFHPSLEMFEAAARAGKNLTINGIHLTEEGNRELPRFIIQSLLKLDPVKEPGNELRLAVREKNRQWRDRYRTIDGYNVYGGRSRLSYTSGPNGPRISNYEVMQEEMSQRDVLTANRDKNIWRVAQGEPWFIDDSNLPDVTQVLTNKQGPKEDGGFQFLSGEEAIERMTPHSGMKIELFADEAQFPDLINPVQMAWDTQGRLWVAVWPNYPERTPTSVKGDSLLIFEDTDGDGKADKQTVFIDDLNGPTGFQFYKDGVLLVQAPDLWYIRDTDGDGRGDDIQRVLMGLDSADSHHTANALCLDPGGAVYLSDGVFHRTQIETAQGVVRNNDAAIYRFEPSTGRFETYAAYGFANPHGRVFDYWGNDLITDATGNNTYFGAAMSGKLDYPMKHGGMRQFWDRPSRPCPGTGILTSRHFPEEFQGNFLNINVIGFQGIFRVGVEEEGSGLVGETLEHIVFSEDPNFRPIALSMGPDGALYFLDWHNPIIGHMQHHLRDPNRDNQHGRIYRVTYEGRPLMEPRQIHGSPIPELLDLLKEPENWLRELAKIELDQRDPGQVVKALKSWIERLDSSDANYEHHMMEALWVHQWLNQVNPQLLDRMLKSPEPRARAAAARVLCYWRDRVDGSLERFYELAKDSHPRVRLEAVRGASFYNDPKAVAIALEILKQPLDYYLEYTLGETMRQLAPLSRDAIAEGGDFLKENPKGIQYLVGRVGPKELLLLPRTAAVLEAILYQDGISVQQKNMALGELAEIQGQTSTAALYDLLSQEGLSAIIRKGLAALLPWQSADELNESIGAPELQELAMQDKVPAVRKAAWAALAGAMDGFEFWDAVENDLGLLNEAVAGIEMIPDAALRNTAHSLVEPLALGNHPLIERLGDGPSAPKARFIRIELPRRGTLTLAEVEVMSGGSNVALNAEATQSSTAYGGAASRAVDGGTSGSYGSNSQTHTSENQDNPWWEVDLGKEFPVETVRIWNRTDGNLGQRLEGFTLLALDLGRRELFRKSDLPAPRESLEIELGSDPKGTLQRAAIGALASMTEAEALTFSLLAELIEKREEVPTAVQAIKGLRRSAWNQESAARALEGLLKWLGAVPSAGRTSLDYVETAQLATDLAGIVPENLADFATKRLKELRVPVFVIRTVREQMRYDIPRIVVEVGKTFEIILKNDDFMPHNLVIVQPDSRNDVGLAAAVMKPDQIDDQGRPFIPQSQLDKILAATPLLEAGEEARLQLVAPEMKGDYEYVCTFPGHHTLMWGWLIVTDDVDAYLAANPKPRPTSPTATLAPAEDHSAH